MQKTILFFFSPLSFPVEKIQKSEQIIFRQIALLPRIFIPLYSSADHFFFIFRFIYLSPSLFSSLLLSCPFYHLSCSPSFLTLLLKRVPSVLLFHSSDPLSPSLLSSVFFSYPLYLSIVLSFLLPCAYAIAMTWLVFLKW